MNITESNSLFSNFDSSNKTKLNDLEFSTFIDSSGSTSGTIMINQINIYKKLQEYCKINKVISWNTQANILPSVNFNIIQSVGGTEPICFVPFWSDEKAVIIFTDGQISIYDMERFKSEIQLKVNNIPIIIILVIHKISNYTIRDLKHNLGIDMSIPETFLSLSNDVVIALTDGSESKVLMSKGEFVKFDSIDLTENTILSNLTEFNYKFLKQIELINRLPSNLIKLDGYNQYINLNNLATSNETNIEVLEKLCVRTILPKINLNLVNNILERLYNQYNINPELEQQIITDTNKHNQLINQYNAMIKTSHTIESNDFLNRVIKLRIYINEYLKDKTQFTYGSNSCNQVINQTNNN